MMLRSIQSKIKERIENLLGLQIIRTSHHGHFDCFDINKSGCQISLVFDVGANIGQSAKKFEAAFPKAKIHCFEPVSATFEILEKNMDGHTNVTCHNIALGDSDGQATVYLKDVSFTSSLVKPNTPNTITGSERVEVRTVDEFVSQNKIERIDLLKIDTEGFDLIVLKGSQNILSAGKVPFVLVEVGFQPGDTRHVLFDEVQSYLAPMGYEVFGIYDQHLEWSGEKRLRFANACFSNESAFTKHK